MLSSSSHSISTPIANSSNLKAIYDEFPDVFEPPPGLPPERDIEHKSNFHDPNASTQNHHQYQLSK